VWTQAADRLRKVYPPFINSYETAKETLTQCDVGMPKFHAFLKVAGVA
jgi:hypothetical protein